MDFSRRFFLKLLGGGAGASIFSHFSPYKSSAPAPVAASPAAEVADPALVEEAVSIIDGFDGLSIFKFNISSNFGDAWLLRNICNDPHKRLNDYKMKKPAAEYTGSKKVEDVERAIKTKIEGKDPDARDKRMAKKVLRDFRQLTKGMKEFDPEQFAKNVGLQVDGIRDNGLQRVRVIEEKAEISRQTAKLEKYKEIRRRYTWSAVKVGFTAKEGEFKIIAQAKNQGDSWMETVATKRVAQELDHGRAQYWKYRNNYSDSDIGIKF